MWHGACMTHETSAITVQGGVGAGKITDAPTANRHILTFTQRSLAAIRSDGGILTFQARPSLDIAQMIR